MPLTGAAPRREVIHAEALAWMDATPAAPSTSVVTSLPDVSELAELGFDGWRAWFVGAVRRVIRWIPADGVAIFFQSDVRHRGAWIDKGHLVLCGADAEGAATVWHRIVCRHPPGTLTQGRASYAHMICLARSARPPMRPGADVLPDGGKKTWSRAMGALACLSACRYLIEETGTRRVVDPFCGRGTVLAVANALGLDAIGVDLSARRCRAAGKLVVERRDLATAQNAFAFRPTRTGRSSASTRPPEARPGDSARKP